MPRATERLRPQARAQRLRRGSSPNLRDPMKAIRVHTFGDPDVMKLEDVPVPAPAAGQVLIDVRSIGVNPVDTYIRAGKYGARPFPFTPGFDAAGVVEAVGDGVTSTQVGDRVYVSRTI